MVTTSNGDGEDRWEGLLMKALDCGESLVLNSTEFDCVCDHIVQLLRDSAILFSNGSAPTAAFLAITAIEETVKVHVGMFRQPTSPATKRSKDPLYQHSDKHRLAATPTVSMGDRLKTSISGEEVRTLIELAQSGKLRELRESCLYFERKATSLQVPRQSVSAPQARRLLLFAIELFDDSLVGYTNHSFDLGNDTDNLFENVAGGDQHEY